MDLKFIKNELKEKEFSLTQALELYKLLEAEKKLIGDIDREISLIVKKFLKNRGWETYTDTESKVRISLNRVNEEKINKKSLKLVLSDYQYAQVVNISSADKVNIITPNASARMKKYVN